MHPIQSILARHKSKVLNNFQKSKYAKKLKMFRAIHNGESCFVIGNGPSLTPQDLNRLNDKNIITFAFNRIYYIFEKTNWRPKYYISQDEKTLGNCKEEVNDLCLPYKFIPLNLHYYYDINIKNAYYFKMVNPDNKQVQLSDDISLWVGNTNTVAITAIQFAVYMGFKKIYLIGIDHNFSTYTNDKGEIITDNTVKDYFTDKYNPDQSELYMPNLDRSTRDFIIARNFCEERGVEVYNATRGGKLEVFPRADFDDVMELL